jgi:hypothetical protein
VRRMLVRGAVAALAATVVTVPGGARPAQADTGSLLGPITQIYSTLAAGGPPQQVVHQVVTAVAGIRAGALAELERVPIAGVRACATRHVVELADLERLAPSAAQAWARDATACAALTDGHLRAAQVGPPQSTSAGPGDAKHTVDPLGLAVNLIGPIAMAARLHAGLGDGGLRQLLVGANTAVITKIQPYCTEWRQYEDDSNLFELWFMCLAYNHNWVTQFGVARDYQGITVPPGCEPWHSCEETPASPPVDKERIRFEATRHTSWVVARAVLPLL